jgi:hypothetical protein
MQVTMQASNTPAHRRMDGLMVFREADGREIISAYASDDNCNGHLFMTWLEARDRSSSGSKKTARDEAKAEAKRNEAADKAALGEVFGALATVLRSRQADAKKNPTATLKRDKRRRRRLFKD